MDPNQSNGADGSQGPFPGWNPYIYQYQAPPTWFLQGYQQGMMHPSGNGPQVFLPPQMPHATNPNDEVDLDEVAVPAPPSGKEKSRKVGSRSKLGNFNLEEDVNIVQSWLEISCDPSTSTSQKKDRMWDRIMQRYNLRRGSYPERSLRSLQSRWDIIKAEVGRFASFYADTIRENPSGKSDADMTTRAAANFASILKHNFGFMHCWEVMKDEPKWQDPKQGIFAKEAAGLGFGEETIHAGASSPTGSVGSRPMGRDSAKASKKNANSCAGSSTSFEYAARMQDLSLQKITIMQEESVRKNERFQQLAYIDEKWFEEMQRHNQSLLHVEQEKVRLMREKHEMEKEEKEKQEDERILGIDLNACTPPQRLYYKALHEEIFAKIAARRRKRQAD